VDEPTPAVDDRTQTAIIQDARTLIRGLARVEDLREFSPEVKAELLRFATNQLAAGDTRRLPIRTQLRAIHEYLSRTDPVPRVEPSVPNTPWSVNIIVAPSNGSAPARTLPDGDRLQIRDGGGER
jgi:hypothetical protein